MAAGRLLVPGWSRALDGDGNPISARISLFLTETDSLATVYANEELSIPLQNPVESNSAGRFPPIWASDTAAYDWSVEAPYGPPGNPFTGIGLTVALAADVLVAEAAEAAADEAQESADLAQQAYEDILALAASLPDVDPVVIAGKADVDGSNITGTNKAAFRTAIEAASNTDIALLNDKNPGRARQLLVSNLYLMNNVNGAVNVLGDSISHGAYSGNAYTNHWTYLLRRAIRAAFGTDSFGAVPMEHVYNVVPSLNTRQIHDVTFSAGWGAVSANPSPYDYPIGNFATGAANIITGKSYSSSTNGSTITIVVPSMFERALLRYVRQPGGGSMNITVNGVAAPSPLNTAGTYLANEVFPVALVDNGKGSTTIVLTKSDSSPTEIVSCVAYYTGGATVLDLFPRMGVNVFAQNGRALSHMSEANIITACNAPCLIMALGFNDWQGLDTDNDNTAFATFQQRINWLIQYCNVHRNLVVVPDFVWFAGPTSRTRLELKRLAQETNGIYLPFADDFNSDGLLTTGSNLNATRYIWADAGAHPNAYGNEMIFSRISESMGLPVTSGAAALQNFDWPFPLPITNVDYVNVSPAFPKQCSSIVRRGKSYEIRLNYKHTSASIPQAGFVEVVAAVDPKFNFGVNLFLADEYNTGQINFITSLVNATLLTSGDGRVRHAVSDANVSRIQKTLVVTPLS